jgi:hypothetical protein
MRKWLPAFIGDRSGVFDDGREYFVKIKREFACNPICFKRR